tara:strand:+ start:649 stop:1245 length:597 start_codon:yes stop_codon:yes gene_type:complete
MAKRLNRKFVSKLVADSRVFKDEMSKMIKEKVEDSKKLMLNEFDRHPVTVEIKGGVNSSNLSKTLPGGYGNLYTFIGFRYGTTPVFPVRNLLSLTNVMKRTRTQVTGTKITTYFKVSTPSEEQITTVSKMPWERGRSWVYGIERGISGFSHYMYKNYALSRSTRGLQSKRKIKSGQFKPMYGGYITKILKNFFDRVSR